MADSIVRLKVESSEYDAKLKRAAEGLSRYANECRKVGGTMEVVEKDTLDYVKAIGQMETTSNTATGKLKEMEKVFVELSVQYKNLTKEEKDSPFGKALASSLDQLKARISDSKGKIDEAKGAISGSDGLTGALDGLAGKFGMSTKTLGIWGAALGAGKIALDVAKDAFFKNEEQLDTWSRVVEASQSAYSGFLDALNTGDISGYLERIGQITSAAQAAYNALDALNTYNAFNQINVEKRRTGMTESIADYRSGQGSKEDVKAAGEAYQKELRERQKLERKAYLEAVKKVAAERGVSGNDLITALSGSYGSYESLKAIPASGRRTVNYGGGMFGGGGSYEVEVPVGRQEELGAALRRLNDTELQSLQALGAQAERTGNEIAQVDRQLARVLNGRQPGSGGGGGRSGGSSGKTPKQEQTEMQQNQQTINTLTQEYVRLGEQTTEEAEKRREAIREEIHLLEERNGLLKLYAENAQGRLMGGSVETTGLAGSGFSGFAGGIGISQEDVSILGNAIAEAFKKTPKGSKKDNPFLSTDDDGKKTAKMTDILGGVAGGIGQMVSGIEALGIEIPEGLKKALNAMQGISSILTGISTTVLAIEAISTADTLIPFARGGIVPHAAGGYAVPGTHTSGDVTPILANSGEMVLSRQQQNILAGTLEGNGLQNMKLSAVARGEDLYLVMNRFTRRSGKGELVTWK